MKFVPELLDASLAEFRKDPVFAKVVDMLPVEMSEESRGGVVEAVFRMGWCDCGIWHTKHYEGGNK